MIILLLLANRIPVVQGYAFIVENPRARSMKKNAKPRMTDVMNVVLQVTSRNVVGNLVTFQTVLIDRIPLQIQAECMLFQEQRLFHS